MSDKKENTLIIMELALKNDKRMLFVVDRKRQNLEEHGEKDLPHNFYLYNTRMCPISWLEDVKEVFLVDADGSAQKDPHDLFQFARSQFIDPVPLDDPEGIYEEIVWEHVREEQKVKFFLRELKALALRKRPGNEKELGRAWTNIISYKSCFVSTPHTLLGLWEKILFSKDYLVLLTKLISEQKETFLVDVKDDNSYTVSYEGASWAVSDVDVDTMTRIKFLLEFKILNNDLLRGDK